MKCFSVLWNLVMVLAVVAIWPGCDTRSNPEVESASDQSRKVDGEIQEPLAGKFGELDMQIPPKDVNVPGLDEEIEKYRSMQVKPEDLGYRPARKGIETGVVIFFGHILPTPYELEFDEERGTFSVNGIEVCPGERLKELNEKFFKKIITPEEQREIAERTLKLSMRRKERERPFIEKARAIKESWGKILENELRKRGVEPYKQYFETIDWEKVKEAAEAAAAIIQEDKRVKRIYLTGKKFSIVTYFPQVKNALFREFCHPLIGHRLKSESPASQGPCAGHRSVRPRTF